MTLNKHFAQKSDMRSSTKRIFVDFHLIVSVNVHVTQAVKHMNEPRHHCWKATEYTLV